jgi:HAD superfamily hydrolase (TIGR01490 family)
VLVREGVEDVADHVRRNRSRPHTIGAEHPDVVPGRQDGPQLGAVDRTPGLMEVRPARTGLLLDPEEHIQPRAAREVDDRGTTRPRPVAGGPELDRQRRREQRGARSAARAHDPDDQPHDADAGNGTSGRPACSRPMVQILTPPASVVFSDGGSIRARTTPMREQPPVGGRTRRARVGARVVARLGSIDTASGGPVSSSTVRRPTAAAFFDLDKTIIATSSAVAFSRPFLAGGLISRRDVLRTAYAQFLYLVGGADADQTERLRAHLSSMVTGWDVAQVSSIVAETLHQSIDPTVYAEAVTLIEDHHAAGHDVVIVSASGSEIVAPIAAMLGADHVIASRMTVEDGRYTGAIDFYAYGDQKAEAIREIAAERGYDLGASYAYSDSITDAPMLSSVGHGFAVNPDRGLRRAAAENGWTVLSFSRPVSLRARLHPTAPVLTVGTVAVLAAAVLVAWRVARWHRARPA